MRQDIDLDQLALANDFCELVAATFFTAYFSRANGMTSTEMLISYDIEAAFDDIDENVRDTMRKTISSACKAVDEGVDFETASAYLARKMKHKITEILGST